MKRIIAAFAMVIVSNNALAFTSSESSTRFLNDVEFDNFGTYQGTDLKGRPCTVIVDIGTSTYTRGDVARYVTVRFGADVSFKLYFSAIISGKGDMPTNAFYQDDSAVSFYHLPKVTNGWHFSHVAPNSTFPWSVGSGFNPRLKAAATVDLNETRALAVQTMKPASEDGSSFFVCRNLLHTVKGEFTGRKTFEWNEAHQDAH